MKKVLGESAWALDAFNHYLSLPKPRRLEDLEGVCPTSPSGKPGRPFRYNTMRIWMATHNWLARAEEFDRKVAALAQEEMAEARAIDARQREEERLEAFRIQRQIALDYWTYPEDYPDEEKRGKVRKLIEMDPQLAHLADRYLHNSATGERLDLGQATSRHEGMSLPSDAANRQLTINVLPPDALPQMRSMLEDMKRQAPQNEAARALESEITEGEVVR